MLSMFSIILFNESNSSSNLAAVFGPIPGTPGMLSDASPVRENKSRSLCEFTPNFSITCFSSIYIFLMGSNIKILWFKS